MTARSSRSASPTDVYERPQSRFVADFVGSSNVLAAGLRRPPWRRRQVDQPEAREDRRVSRRARQCRRSTPHADGEIKMISYQGAVTRFSVEAEDMRITAEVAGRRDALQAGRQRAADLAQIGHGHHGGRRVSQRRRLAERRRRASSTRISDLFFQRAQAPDLSAAAAAACCGSASSMSARCSRCCCRASIRSTISPASSSTSSRSRPMRSCSKRPISRSSCARS